MSSRADIATLKRKREYPALTFYLRILTDPSGHEHNVINKKRWIDYFDYITSRHGMSKQLTKRLKKRFESILEIVMERPTKPGAVIFLSTSVQEVRLADFAFEQQVYIDDHFYVEPLLSQINKQPAAMLLTLSQNGANLYRVTNTEFQKIDMPDIEQPLNDVLRLDEFSPSIQSHNRGRGGLHGQGGYKDQKEKLLRAYVRHIDKSIRAELKKRKLPLILFGAKSIVPVYRKSSSYNQVSDKSIFGSPAQLRTSEIHNKVRPLINRVVTV